MNNKEHTQFASQKREEQLLEGVIDRGKSIAYIAKKLRMKYTTALKIVSQYKDNKKVKIQEGTQKHEKYQSCGRQKRQLVRTPPTRGLENGSFGRKNIELSTCIVIQEAFMISKYPNITFFTCHRRKEFPSE